MRFAGLRLELRGERVATYVVLKVKNLEEPLLIDCSQRNTRTKLTYICMKGLKRLLPPMHIDRHTGTIKLPNGYAIEPNLSQQEFRANQIFSHSRCRNCGTLPWIHYEFSGGELKGKTILVGLCFYDQTLVSVSVSANLYPPGNADWSNYSLDVEAAAKRFHERILTDTLGKPTKSEQPAAEYLSDRKTTLTSSHTWAFAWGSVNSAHDSKGGGTFLTISYGNREALARKAYHRLQAGPNPLSKLIGRVFGNVKQALGSPRP